jgi:hypothetical protein
VKQVIQRLAPQLGSGAKPSFEPKTSDFANRVRSSFFAQQLLVGIGARLASVEPGEVLIELQSAPI